MSMEVHVGPGLGSLPSHDTEPDDCFWVFVETHHEAGDLTDIFGSSEKFGASFGPSLGTSADASGSLTRADGAVIHDSRPGTDGASSIATSIVPPRTSASCLGASLSSESEITQNF